MQTFTFTQGKYHSVVFMLSEEACPCVYCTMEPEIAKELAERLAGQKLALVAVSGVTWEDELSPWPASKAFRSGRDFGGGADAYIRIMEQKILPEAEKRLGFSPVCRIAAGYSLAGLWSLYALYRTRVFQRIVCASGSLWYEGFLDFMRKNPISQLPEKVYFSLGDKEKLTKNQRMAVVGERTKEAVALLNRKGVNTIFVENPGGHFQEPVERLARGIRWALGD